jgi:hypothetical protein
MRCDPDREARSPENVSTTAMGPLRRLQRGSRAWGARLAAVASMLQERLDCPQDVEGMLTSDDRLYIVQTRPQQGI